ncbi:hypothetical protein [Acidisphaera sp. S103]|uniref:hypothetical protein n=1 Tax=Acidisphaera sp. S103 TaxID=1747223 RepID=UPI00131AF651|nr:hypothetical protein [Acidisphaera sp. S103]
MPPAEIADDAEKIRDLVQRYCAEQRNSHLAPFVVHGPVMAGDEVYRLEASQKPGCYVFYGRDGRYHYIGMSLVGVGSRVAAHLNPGTQASPFWHNGKPPYSVDLIEVTEAWEAPSLEAYLYAKMAGTAQLKE